MDRIMESLVWKMVKKLRELELKSMHRAERNKGDPPPFRLHALLHISSV